MLRPQVVPAGAAGARELVVEPARPPQPVASNNPRAGAPVLIPELYIEPLTTSEPLPVEINPALEERFAQFASGAVASANDEPALSAGEPLSAHHDSSPVVAKAEGDVEAVAEAVALPHAHVDSFLEAHFAGQPPAEKQHLMSELAPAPVVESPFAQVQAKLRVHTTATSTAVMELPPVEVPATHDDVDVRGSRCRKLWRRGRRGRALRCV